MRTGRVLSHTLIFFLGFTACAVVVNRLPPYQGMPALPPSTASLATYRSRPAAPVVQGRYSVANAIDRVESAVVNIETISRPLAREGWEQLWLRRWLGRPAPRRDEDPVRGVASGVIVSTDGYVLTNNHVVDEAERIQITLPDKRRFTGQVIGTDAEDDLAILKIDGQSLPTAVMGDSARVRKGEWVVAIGNPLGFESTVTVGVVSAERRDPFTVEGKTLRHVIQTDAAINQGNSGGALVNLDGELIGINTAIVSTSSAGGSIGIGFAIPINDARPIVSQLIRYGRVLRPWMGIKYEPAVVTAPAAAPSQRSQPEADFQPQPAAGNGVVVRQVLRGSPAETAGLKEGDVIRRLNTSLITGTEDVYSFISRHSPGQRVRVTVHRQGRPTVLSLRLGQKPPDAGRRFRE
jgi:S1-C subfamily serine protease